MIVLRAVAILAGIFLFATGAVTSVAAEASGPRITCEAGRFDFGEIPQFLEVKHQFELKNTGNAPLEIREVLTTCGCTVAMLDTKEIPPGGSGRVEVTFKAGNLAGAVHKSVTVRSNDPAKPLLDLHVVANVQAVFTFLPSTVNLGEIERGQGLVREVILSDVKNQPFEIKAVVCSDPDLKAEFAPVPGNNKTIYRLKLALNAARNLGPLFAKAVVQTDRVGVPSPELMVLGSVIGPVRASPTAVFLGLVKPGEKFQPKKVTVKTTGSKPLEIKSVDSGDPMLKATLTTVTAGNEYAIEVVFTQTPPPGWYRRTMKIFTNDSDQPLEVPLSGVVTNPTGGRPIER